MRNSLFTLIVFVLLFSLNAQSAKWRVCNTAGIDADFTSFKQAHDAVNTGDTLMFEGSNLLYGDKDTLKKMLVIIGPGYFIKENDLSNDHILSADLYDLYVDSAAKGSVIMGMSFKGPSDCLQIDADNVIVERNYVNDRVTLCYHKPITNCVISKNFVNKIGTRWSSNTLFATGTLITNNILKSEISLNLLSTATITNNSVGAHILCYSSTVKNNISGYLDPRTGTTYQYNIVSHTAPAGTGNIGGITDDNIYVGGNFSTDSAYVLSETSLAKSAGEGTVDCGAFGGNDSYILSGFPPFPVIFNAIIPSTGTYELPIKIEARSQK